MIKIIILIFLIAILIWWLSGYSNARSIKPKRNRWQAWGPFNQTWGFIDGDKKSFLPKSMPWPFNKVFFTLTYTKFVEDGKLEKHTGISEDGKIITYNEAQQIHGIKKPIRNITEEVTRLRKVEIHPYIIKVTLPKVAGIFYFVFTLKIKIKNPMKVLKMDEFLIFVGNQLNDRFVPWAIAYEKTLYDNKSHLPEEKRVNDIIDELLGLSIDNDRSVILEIENEDGSKTKITLKDYMNNVVREYGGFIGDFSLEVGYDDKIKAILDLRNEQNQEIEKNKKEEKVSITRGTVRAREKADELQLIELDKKELEDVIVPEMEAQALANEKSNSAWKVTTLAIGDTKTAIVLPQSRRRAEKGGANVTT